jgi:hypothetical protein
VRFWVYILNLTRRKVKGGRGDIVIYWTFAFHAIPASQRQLSIAWDIPVATPAVILSTGVTPTVPAGGSSRPKARGGL